MKNKIKTVFVCQTCGSTSPKWLGRCPDCSQWDTFAEEIQHRNPIPGTPAGPGRKHSAAISTPVPTPVPIDAVDADDEQRTECGIQEFDRVLGGGLVAGSLVLIGGDPGIGKSTLMLQALFRLADRGHTVLYVSGEESVRQLRLRSRRLGTLSPRLLVVSEIETESVMRIIADVRPDVAVVDSIQTMFNSDLSSAPGSVTQVRESAMRLMIMAKKSGIPVFIVGHVTKDGAIAGPRLLEHMVDTVLYFEGDRSHVFRILRAVKNRFGSTNEIGVFEMKEKGLEEVPNPSTVFLSERPSNAPGSVVTASMEGSRPILIEIQALASSSNLGTPRRTILGLDPNRVALLLAVMEKKLGMHLMGHDIFMNVAGGVKVHEPAVDMGIVAAVASSFLDRPIPEGHIVMGEVGLTGEIRAISHVEPRVNETLKMGFRKCIIPESNLKRMKEIKGIELAGVRSVAQAVEILF